MTDLAIRQVDPADLAPRLVQSLDDLKQQLQDLLRFKKEILVEGEDYGTIPGTPKPTLLKPGAEKLSLAFGLAPTFVNVGKIEDWDGGLFHYEEECRLTSKRTGEIVASANGSANSREPRYRWRKADRTCPVCEQATIFKSKNDGGWYCWAKKGGCSAQFAASDTRITEQKTGNVANPEPYELVNTIKKMAQKRALVAAALIATGGSGHFTQDVEDMPSISGEPEVIEGNSRVIVQEQPAAKPATARPVPQYNTEGTGPLIHEADPLWRAYRELADEAGRFRLAVPNVTPPIRQSELVKHGKALRDAVNTRKAELAAQQTAIYGSDEDGTAFADLPVPIPPAQDARPLGAGATAPEPAGKAKAKPKPATTPIVIADEQRFQRYVELMAEARALDIYSDPYQLEVPAEASKVEATIVALEQDILRVEQAESEAAVVA